MCAVAVHVAGVRLFTFIVIQVDSKIQSVCISCMHPQINILSESSYHYDNEPIQPPPFFSFERGGGRISILSQEQRNAVSKAL